MKNPFLDFQSVSFQKKEIPLERIVRSREDVMGQIVLGYLRLVEDEVKDLVWLVEHSRVVKAYNAAVKSIRLQYDSDDMEEFCTDLDSSNKIPYLISGPAGIYLSALVNHASEERMVLGPGLRANLPFPGLPASRGKDPHSSGGRGGLHRGGSLRRAVGGGRFDRELVRRRDDEGRNPGRGEYRAEHRRVDAGRRDPRGRSDPECGDPVRGNTGKRVVFGGKIYRRESFGIPRALVSDE